MKSRLIPALALLLGACGFQAPAPKVTSPPETPPAPVSTLAAELRLPAADIARFLNDKTQKRIARLDDSKVKCPLAHCRLDLVATRNGPITARIEGARLALTLPFALDARMSFKLPFMKSSGEAHGTGRVLASSAFTLGPDWELLSRTQGRIEISRADLRLGPLRAELSNLLADQSEAIAKPIFKEVDKQLPKWANLRKHVAELWAKANAPIQIGKSPQAWLLLTPRHIFVGTPRAQGDALVLALGLETQARVQLGAEPQTRRPPPLPPREPMRARPEPRFHLQVPAMLPYGEAARLANERLKQPIMIGKSARVRVEQIAIIPSHDDVVVAARLCLAQEWDPFGWFDACGVTYLRGIPVFDGGRGVLRIKDVRYDAGTANLLVGAWSRLSGSDFTRELERRLVFDLSGQIAKLKEQVGRALAQGTRGHLALSGEMERFSAPTLTWTKEGFIALFSAEGTAHISFQP